MEKRGDLIFQGRSSNVLRLFCLMGAGLLSSAIASQAVAGDYLNSAHGNSTLGVNRKNIPASGYSIGNCAHCHEVHASRNGEEPTPPVATSGPVPFNLFANTFNASSTPGNYLTEDVFCFYCHGTPTIQDEAEVGVSMHNYDYAKIFGGYDGGPDYLNETFNQYDHTNKTGSNHNLLSVRTYAATNFNSYFHAESDPCSACHNVHLARDYKNHPNEAGYSAISRPTDHYNLWGDETDENMDDAAGIYRSPYYWGGASREPGGTAITDGSTTPNYNDFCLDCHGGTTPTITSANRTGDTYYSTAVLRDIDWTTATIDAFGAGDKHGVNTTDAADNVETRAPYNGDHSLTLSCMDCHEAHGSVHKALVRRSINGTPVTTAGYPTSDVIGDEDGDRGWQCRQCHKDDYELKSATDQNRNKWSTTHHGGGPDNPYQSAQDVVWAIPANAPGSCKCHVWSGTKRLPIKCENCHYHGSWLSGVTGVTVDAGLPTERVIPPPAFPAPGSGVYSRKTF